MEDGEQGQRREGEGEQSAQRAVVSCDGEESTAAGGGRETVGGGEWRAWWSVLLDAVAWERASAEDLRAMQPPVGGASIPGLDSRLYKRLDELHRDLATRCPSALAEQRHERLQLQEQQRQQQLEQQLQRSLALGAGQQVQPRLRAGRR